MTRSAAMEPDPARELLQAIFDSTPDMLFVHGPDGRLIDVNPSVERTYGLSREEILRCPPERIIGSGHDLEMALERLALARAGQPQDFEWMARRADGSEFPVEVRLRALGTDGRVLAQVRDISDRHDVGRFRRAVSAREEEHERLLEILPQAVGVHCDGILVYVNQAACRLFAAPSRDHLLGRPILDFIPAELHDRVAVRNRRLLTEGASYEAVEEPLLRQDGSSFWARTSATVTSYRGRTAILALAEDITERRQREAFEIDQQRLLELTADPRVGLKQVLTEAVLIAERHAPGMLGSILLLDDDRLRHGAAPHLPAAYNRLVDGLKIGPDVGSCGAAAFRRTRVVVEDIATDPLWAPYAEIAKGFGLGACWSQPILDASGQVLGTFALYYRGTRAPSPWELSLIETCARISGTAVIHKRTLEEIRTTRTWLNAAQHIARLGSWEADLSRRHRVWWSEEVYRIFELPVSTTPPRFSRVLGRIHPEDRRRVVQGHRGAMKARTSYRLEYRLLLARGRIKHIQERGYYQDRADQGGLHALGTLQDVSERYETEARLRRLSSFDELTGLANRRLFLEHLEQAIGLSQRTGHPLALLYFDLNRFKNVNDALGHEAGDLLLRQLARRLYRCARRADTVARLGGDEFAALLPEANGLQAVEAAERFGEAAAQPFELLGQQVTLGASVGIVIYPDDGKDAKQLLKRADIAMYRAKAARAPYALFTDGMERDVRRRLNLEQELAQAITGGGLRLHYQPQFRLTGTELHLRGYEALVRWSHPRLGLIPPDEFIQIAEEVGLIQSLTAWVFAEACRQARIWLAAGRPLLPIAVNLSAVQLIHYGLAGELLDLVRAQGLPPQALEVEITESAAMRYPDTALEIMEELVATGMGIAIDDFGTGHSSLAYLKRFPTALIKLDRSFIDGLPEDPGDVAIVHSTLAMVHALGKEVLAEGVETQAQLDFLRDAGCDLVQGYLLGRPAAAD